MRSAFRVSILANILLATGLVFLLLSDSVVEDPLADFADASVAGLDVVGESEAEELGGTDSGLSRIAVVEDEHEYGIGLNPDAVGHLERMGISREVIAKLVLGEFHRQWDQRFIDLERRYAPRSVPDWEYVVLERERGDLEARALEGALGKERYASWDRARTMRLLNTGGVALDSDELFAAYDLQKAFEKEHRELQRSMDDGLVDRADASALQAFALEERDRQLMELLGEETFRKMRGMVDPLERLYQEFGDMEPTNSQVEEALEVENGYKDLQSELEVKVSGSLSGTSEVAQELERMALFREGRLREIFGEAAYESSEREKDPMFKTLVQYADAWELSDHEVRSVYVELDAFHDKVGRFREAAGIRQAAGQEVDWRQLEGVVEGDRQKIEARLEDLIGTDRFSRLKRNGLLKIR